MAVYYKFNSEKDFDSISLGDSPFISVAKLKEKIFQAKLLYRGKDCYLVVSNAQTNEEYLDEEMLIPKYTSVLIRRVPGWLYVTIITEKKRKVQNTVAETEAKTIGVSAFEDSEWDDYGDELHAFPRELPIQSSNLIPEVSQTTNKADEDSKIKALINTPQLNWHRQGLDGFGPSRGLGRGLGGWMADEHGFGLQQKTPPPGYVCHRCQVSDCQWRQHYMVPMAMAPSLGYIPYMNGMQADMGVICGDQV
ncbi:E3 ubiquitin ligase PARAQUAT TOLERANCE 3-like isoform X3 [Prosopis cineraria]|uniref:E3 ubiquitin ligase PARAQUAT TOLERANCE 3-like isoform X3 n=1 Tax=Prosopis cineraria TaxID=364024 RepID=UPI00240F65EA|nr:E3 ubiquitin ligase PARAQUAT TOLERANCE 3-like isoform X3 [Prosopis cineraria]